MRVALAMAVLLLVPACVSQDRFRKKEAEAAELKARGAELEAALAAKKAELEASQQKTRALQAQIDELSASKTRLESTKAELEKRSSELEKKSTELERKSSEYEKMASALRGEIESGRIELTELRGKMTVKMKDKILFSSGSATIGKDGKAALAAVAEVLRGVEGKVFRVEGHTDNVPLGRGAYTNWELSSARALAVVRYLQDQGVDPARLAAAGYGEFKPIAPNDTPEGRSQNRRIEIVLAPADAPEPSPAPASGKM
jgi:chemotaxis protein MotB